MKIRKFKPEDLAKIAIQPQQAHEMARADLKLIRHGRTLEDSAGNIFWIFGCLDVKQDEGFVYSYVSEFAGRHMSCAIKYLKRLTDKIVDLRVRKKLFMTVKNDFISGKRMAEMLGFVSQNYGREIDGVFYSVWMKEKRNG